MYLKTENYLGGEYFARMVKVSEPWASARPPRIPDGICIQGVGACRLSCPLPLPESLSIQLRRGAGAQCPVLWPWPPASRWAGSAVYGLS